MAAHLPAALKAADLSRFADRAAELEKAKPIISYWCRYWIVNQILAKGLQDTDQECLGYTTDAMDKLEQFQAQNSSEPAVTEDLAGKAYVEQFALDTFSKADNAVKANKATRQTALTFQASAVFLDVLHIWGAVDPEITAKSKFAKYHTLRIIKALKAGEDPNLSNPVQEPAQKDPLPALDPNDPDVQMLEGGENANARQPSVVEVPDEAHRLQESLAQRSSIDQSLHPSRDTSMPPTDHERQPSVVEIPDEADRLQSNLARQSSLDESLHPSRAPSIPRPPANDVSPLAAQDASAFYTGQNHKADISPLNSPSEREPSIGGNYFPRVPSPLTGAEAPVPVVSAASEGKFQTSAKPTPVNLPSAPAEASFISQPSKFAQPPQPPPHHHGELLSQPRAGETPQIPPNFAPQAAPRQPIPLNPPQLRQSQGLAPSIQPAQSTASQPVAPALNVVVDEEAMMKAQKHARWAISALNFEDVPTAIKELRDALQTLGAS